jgi:tryptophan 7-halogenase
MTPGPVRDVVVVGRDTALWMIAVGLARTVSRIGVRVRIVELPSTATLDAVHAGLPSLGNFHALLGLNEAALYTSCAAVPSLGQQYVGWSTAMPSFIHGYDAARPAINDVEFLHFWSLARRHGLKVAYEDFSLAAVAAKQGRVTSGKPGQSWQTLSPGIHVDARAYAALMRRGCEAAELPTRASASVTVERDGDRIQALVLDDGERVEGDLFIDASGRERALIGSGEFEPWSDAFPADHRFAAALPPLDPPPVHARIVAGERGWLGLFPLQDRVAVAGHIARGEDGQGAVARLLDAAGSGRVSDLAFDPFVSGALRRSWVGNCIAVGDAAASLERLDAPELHWIQVALSNLVDLWPVSRAEMPEARSYDRAMATHLDAMRSFQQAHYRLSGREEPMWQRARKAAGERRELMAQIDLFAARGLIAHRDNETFSAQSWAAMLIGHGVEPADSDPAVDRTPEDEQMGKVRQLLIEIADTVRAMPGTAEFIAARRAGR